LSQTLEVENSAKGNKNAASVSSAASYMSSDWRGLRIRHARRHWNCTSYRAAAGKNQDWREACQSVETSMELRGIEPLTSAVRLQRSPS
jgi:hypothetical protein